MPESQVNPYSEPSAAPALTPLFLIIAWLWVGIPLAFGVYRTVVSSKPLFEKPAAAAPTVAPEKKT